jgi:NAD(P)-dependent dehydrogenase (short-subunit alcohol dehydrogenase family)
VLLEGKAAIVSGVGPGLGRSIAVALAREGASVGMGARTPSTLESVAEEIEAAGGRAVWRRTDISAPDDCRALVEATAEAFGRVDVLVNSGHHKVTSPRSRRPTSTPGPTCSTSTSSDRCGW